MRIAIGYVAVGEDNFGCGGDVLLLSLQRHTLGVNGISVSSPICSLEESGLGINSIFWRYTDYEIRIPFDDLSTGLSPI